MSPWARDAVLKLWRTGLLVGHGGNFMPLGNATRAQAATICYRTDETVATWYSEPGVASTRVRVNPATGLPYDDGSKPADPSKPTHGNGGSSGGSGGGGGTTPSDSWSVSFYDGFRLIKNFNVKKGEPLGQLPTVAESSKANYILEGYYTDSNFTTPFYAENPVTRNMSVYAKYESMGDPETLTLDSFARMDQQPNVSFRFKPLAGTADTLEVAKAAVSLAVKDGTDPVVIEVSGSGVYTVNFVPLTTDDQLRLYEIPDNFPIKVDALPTGAGNAVNVSQLDTALYAQMVGAGKGTLDNVKAALGVGDFVSLYVDSAASNRRAMCTSARSPT